MRGFSHGMPLAIELLIQSALRNQTMIHVVIVLVAQWLVRMLAPAGDARTAVDIATDSRLTFPSQWFKTRSIKWPGQSLGCLRTVGGYGLDSPHSVRSVSYYAGEAACEMV